MLAKTAGTQLAGHQKPASCLCPHLTNVVRMVQRGPFRGACFPLSAHAPTMLGICHPPSPSQP